MPAGIRAAVPFLREHSGTSIVNIGFHVGIARPLRSFWQWTLRLLRGKRFSSRAD
jgi:hypothetical protein